MSRIRVSDMQEGGPDIQAGSPGAILRRCREFHGITLEEASDTTKIGISHLRALEEDRIREFANQAYLKGFLRIYATYLGLDSEDIARLYDKLFGVKEGKADVAAKPVTTNPRSRKHIIQLKKLILPACLLVIILISAAFFKRAPESPVRTLPVASAPVLVQGGAVQSVVSSARVKKIEEVAPEKPEKIQKEQVAAEEAAPPKRMTETAKGFILKIKVTQNGTLTVIVDNAAAQQYDLTAGDIIEWKAEKKVTLDLSNAGGVEVELNGKPYKALGAPGKPAYVEMDADGIKQ